MEDCVGIQLARLLGHERHAPVVYFARRGKTVKIGTTTFLRKRMASLNMKLTDVAMVVPGGRDVEAAFHQRWRHYRINGEWFHILGSLASFMEPDRPPRGHVRQISATENAPITLRNAAKEFQMSYAGLRQAIHRAPQSQRPEAVGKDGNAELYMLLALAEFLGGRPRTPLPCQPQPEAVDNGRSEVDGVDRMDNEQRA